MSPPRIVPLARVPQCIGALARAHVEAFGALLPDWTPGQAEAELAAHGCDGIPATWLALGRPEHASAGGCAVEGTSVPTLCQESPSGPKSLPQDSLLQNEDWLGSVSLLHDDHPLIRDYSPWLASLYVRPQARGRGVGAALVAHCVAAARGLGVARLFLYCELPLLPFYARLGWTLETLVELPLLPRIAVMAIDTAATAR